MWIAYDFICRTSPSGMALVNFMYLKRLFASFMWTLAVNGLLNMLVYVHGFPMCAKLSALFYNFQYFNLLAVST